MSEQDLPTIRPTAAAPAPAPFSFAPESYASGNGDEEEGPGLRRYLMAVLRYKWLALGIVAAGLVLGVASARMTSPLYQAEARLWLTVVDQTTREQGPIQSGQLLQQDAWRELALSYTVLDWVVQDQRMWLWSRGTDRDVTDQLEVESTYMPGSYVLQVSDDGGSVELQTADGVTLETVRPGEAIGRGIGLRWEPPAGALRPGRKVNFQVRSRRDAARALGDGLTINVARQGNFMTVSYSGSSAERTAAVLNSFLERYVEVAADLKKARLLELRTILESQVARAAAYLQDAEMALEDFRIETITLPSEPATPVAPGLESTRQSSLDRFFSLRIQRDQLEQDAAAIEGAVARGRGEVSIDALNMVASAQQSPELSRAMTELTEKRAALRTLRRQFTDEHPTVKQAAADLDSLETGVIPRLAAALTQEIRNQVRTLDGLIGTSSTELRQIPPRVIDEARRRRAVQTAEALYTELRQRYESARLAEESAGSDVRVLDAAAVPRRPLSDRRMQVLMMAVLVSLALGVGIPILLDRLDPRLHYPEQVSAGMRLPILGAVPHLRSGRWRLLGAPDQKAVIEALRHVRLNLTHAYGAAGPVVVTVTSPGPGDGKSFLTANLGLAYAELGMRTLLIDGDTRRGCLHRMLGVDRKPGLTDFVAGNVDFESLVRKTTYELLDVIPCGTRSANSPELLSAPAMGELLAAVKARYQVVLLDSPPLGAGIDPLVLSTLSGNMLLVVRAGRTNRAVAEAKLQMMDRLPVRLVGAVLNGAKEEAGYYRYYSYLPGYEAGREEQGGRLLEKV